MADGKTALTFEEKITAAHLHYVQGVDQHKVAFALGVNAGRVNEACTAIWDACHPNIVKLRSGEH